MDGFELARMLVAVRSCQDKPVPDAMIRQIVSMRLVNSAGVS
jgi:hypothetical protein